jgi:hypothetical protein
VNEADHFNNNKQSFVFLLPTRFLDGSIRDDRLKLPVHQKVKAPLVINV